MLLKYRTWLSVVIAILSILISVGCSSKPARDAGHDANSPGDTQQPPMVVLDGRDLNLGSGVVSASAVCADHPPANVNWGDAKRRVAWRGVTNGQQPDVVALAFLAAATKTMWTIEISSGGQQYENPWKDTDLTVDGPSNGWYRFSGTVRMKDADYDDPTYKVNGSIACANYGAPF